MMLMQKHHTLISPTCINSFVLYTNIDMFYKYKQYLQLSVVDISIRQLHLSARAGNELVDDINLACQQYGIRMPLFLLQNQPFDCIV